MMKLHKISPGFILITILLSILFIFSACDDNFNEKIETEKELVKLQGQPEPEPFSPGNNGIIIIRSVSSNSVFIRWNKIHDTDMKPVKATYSIYVSTENNINTIREATANGDLKVEKYNIHQCLVRGLRENFVYYINIIAEDDYGNASIYSTAAVLTKNSDEIEEDFDDGND